MDITDLLLHFDLPLDRAKHVWISEWLTSKEYLITAVIITSIQSLILPILFGLHIYRLIKGTNTVNYEKGNPLRIKYKIIDNLSLLSITFSFISGIITICNYLSLLNDNFCTFLSVIQNLFWLLIKISVYLTILLRLDAIFHGSIYEINVILKYVCHMCIITFTVICGIGSVFAVKSIPLEDTNFCLLIIPSWLILTPMIFDILCSALSFYLFTNPLKKIIKNCSGNTEELNKLFSKYILISSIAIISNLFSSLWFAITDILIFIYLDAFLNPICLILMQIHHNDIYNFLCKVCHRSLDRLIGIKSKERSVTRKTTRSVVEPPNLQLNKIRSISVNSVVSPTLDVKVTPIPAPTPIVSLPDNLANNISSNVKENNKSLDNDNSDKPVAIDVNKSTLKTNDSTEIVYDNDSDEEESETYINFDESFAL